MSSNSPDDPSSHTDLAVWRTSGHKIDDLPYQVRALLRSQLAVPKEHDPAPGARLSVLDFAVSELPPVSLLNAFPADFTFFSKSPPSPVSASDILLVPVPPKGVVATLLAQAGQQYLDGAESVVHPGSDILFPIWVLTFWSNCHIEYAPAQQKWGTAIGWLQRADLQPFNHAVGNVFKALSSLTWSGKLSYDSLLGPVTFSKDLLSIFLSSAWLADEHVDLLISWLVEKLASDSGFTSSTPPTLLFNTCHIHLIQKAYNEGSTDGSNKTVLDRLGRTLNSASQVAGIFHVNGNHWVAMVVIPSEGRVLYGDPAGLMPDKEIASAIVWFCQQHLPSTPSLDTFSFEVLPSPSQNLSVDWWNCGVFSFNALDHHLFPAETPLFQFTEKPGFGNAARISLLDELIKDRSAKSGLGGDWPTALKRQDLSRYLSITSAPTTGDAASTTTAWPIQWSKDADTDTSKPKKAKGRKSTKKKPAEAAPPQDRTHSDVEATKKSYLAPIFNVPALPNPSDSLKRKADEESESPNLAKKQYAAFTHLSTPDEDASDTESDSPSNQHTRGRPSDDVMDVLTVLVDSTSKPKTYRCAGKGCKKTWKPRAASRVLPHCKNCLFMSVEQRKLASQHSASTAPGALVDADKASASKIQQSQALVPSSSTSSIASNTTVTSDTFFGAGGRKQIHHQLDFAIVRLVCAAALSGSIVDRAEWREIFKIATPTYSPASRTKLVQSQIQSEQSRVKELQYAILRNEKNVSISYDGGAIRSGESVYTVHATLPDGRVFFLHGENGTGVSHTGAWIAGSVLRVVDNFGRENVGSASSDNTGNTRVGRVIVNEAIPRAFNLPDPQHHMNNTWLEIGGLEYFATVIKVIRGTIKHFKHSNLSRDKLTETRIKFNIGRGLESSVPTRFTTTVWSGLSLQRCLPAIRELVTTGVIEIPNFNHYFVKDTPLTLQLEIWLAQMLAVGECFARASVCLEGTNANPADVYFYWVAIVSRLKRNLETCHLPDDVCQAIRRIVIRRWKEFFVHGPTNVHLSAFYLHPDYVRSPILHNPNRLAFSITIPAGENVKSKVPPGIRSPKVFLQVGEYLYWLIVNELTHGDDPHLRQFASKPAALTKVFKIQFTAWAQGTYPFAIGLGPGQSPLQYWKVFEGTADGGVLAAIAIRLFSATPHSMADERTMSYITLLNTALRSRQKLETVIAMAQVRAYYQAIDTQKKRRRNAARTGEALRFFDVRRLTREIEDDHRHDDPDYEPSDDEDDMPQPSPVESETTAGGVESTVGTVLPGEEPGSELDLSARVVRELLSDAPVPLDMTKYSTPKPALPEIEAEEEGGSFELGGWV